MMKGHGISVDTEADTIVILSERSEAKDLAVIG